MFRKRGSRVNESSKYIFAILFIGGMFIKYLSGYMLKHSEKSEIRIKEETDKKA